MASDKQNQEYWQKPVNIKRQWIEGEEKDLIGTPQFDAKRLVAEVCRLKFHPKLQGYFFRTYVILESTSAYEDGMPWNDYLILAANPVVGGGRTTLKARKVRR